MTNVHEDGLFGSQPGLKLDPSFRQEDQDMAQELKPIIVGPPAYASPDPATIAGRLVAVEEHPLSADLAEDYGADMKAAYETDVVATTMTPEETAQAIAAGKLEGAPDNRDEWTKAHWQAAAKAHGLSDSGNKNALKDRVEEYEAAVNADKELSAEDWKGEIDAAENADDLGAIRQRYGASGADYSTVAKAFDDREAELREQS